MTPWDRFKWAMVGGLIYTAYIFVGLRIGWLTPQIWCP